MLTSTIGHAANDIVVDGVVYTYNNGSYVVTGCDETTPIQSLHILGELDDGFVEGIADNAFYGNEDIIYLIIDEGIEYIGEDAFYGCSNIEVAILPEGLITIEEGAFAYCTSLTKFVIPSTVRDIQAQAFMGCTGVTDVYFLITEDTALEAFVWWDGWYQNVPGDYQSSDPHGGIEFKTSRKPYEGDDPRIEHDPINGTVVHIPAGTRSIYDESQKLEAWLLEEDDGGYPLWWIVNYGVVGREYTVADDFLTAVYVDESDNHGLYVKNDNKWLTPDVVYPDEVDFMRTTGLMNKRNNIYDQSNWAVLTNVNTPYDYAGHLIVGNSITGTLKNKKNPVVEIKENTELVKGTKSTYIPNTYIPASFMGRTQLGAEDITYAFVQPKPQEFMHVEWAIYWGNDENDDTDDAFYLPDPDENSDVNYQKLKGGFRVNYGLYEQPPVPSLEDEGVYSFDAINRSITNEEEITALSRLKKQNYAPYVDGGVSESFMVFPLELPEEPISTATTDISISQQVSNLWYSIDGRLLGTTKPSIPGIYINDKKKVIVAR